MRKLSYRPWLEFLAERVSPGDMFWSLNSSSLLGSALLSDPDLLSSPSAEAQRPTHAGSLLARRLDDQSSFESRSSSFSDGGAQNFRTDVGVDSRVVDAGSTSNVAARSSADDLLNSALANNPFATDDLTAAALSRARPASFHDAGVTSTTAAAGFDGAVGSTGSMPWTSGNMDPYTVYMAGNGYTGADGIDRQTFMAQFGGALSPIMVSPGHRVALHHNQQIGTAANDPGDQGPLAVTTQEYNFGDTAFQPTNFPGPVELLAQVKAPTDLSGGPYPLVVLMHGRHFSTYQGFQGFLEWPPGPGHQAIPSYKGYDYFGDVLASHGYIVVSLSANGISARDNSVFDLGANARAQLFQRTLDIWRDLSTGDGTVQPFGIAPFGTRFVGNVDLTNVGIMGHSRGGEGAVQEYLYNQSLGSPYGINAVFALAPADFNRPVINNVPFAVLLPYNDGDLSDLQGIHYFDDIRYNVPGDSTAKFSMLVMGANHNYYNTIWTPGSGFAGAVDDGFPGPPTRLTPAQERGTGLAYMSAFFRTYLGGEDWTYLMKGDDFPPPSAQITYDQIHFGYQGPDDGTRLDVNRMLTLNDLNTNTLGGTVHTDGLTGYTAYGGEDPEQRWIFTSFGEGRTDLPGGRFPHTVQSARNTNKRGLSQVVVNYTGPGASYENDIPTASQDESSYYALQFRVNVNWTSTLNPSGRDQDFSVKLTDTAGNAFTTQVSSFSNALYYPPGSASALPKVFLNTVRIPLYVFSNGGVDLTHLAQVEFDFDQTATGAFLFADLAFADPYNLYG
jgi:hypothetical protein